MTVNFLGDAGKGAIRAGYRSNYDRLARISVSRTSDPSPLGALWACDDKSVT